MTMHYCLTDDGMRITCICTTGRDHDEDEMDLGPDAPLGEARDADRGEGE